MTEQSRQWLTENTMTKERYRIGIIGGLKLPVNVEVLLENIERLLSDHEIKFDLDLIIRQDAASDLDGYNVYDPGFNPPSRALDMPISVTRGTVEYVREYNPDVLFQITEFASHGTAAVTAGRLSNTPTITRLAGDDFNEYRFSSGVAKAKVFAMRNVLGRIPLVLSDGIAVLGPHVKEEVESRLGHSDVYRVPQPINRSQFHTVSSAERERIRAELDLVPEERVFLSVGRLTPRKGMDDVIQVAKELNARGEDFKWIVLGSGRLYDALDSTPNVDPRGKVPHNEIERYYQVADLFVHPSRIDGLPNVLLEATACGTPSIARDIGECDVVSTQTFEERDELRELLTRDYDRVDLPDQFSDEHLRSKYVDLLVTAAEGDV